VEANVALYSGPPSTEIECTDFAEAFASLSRNHEKLIFPAFSIITGNKNTRRNYCHKFLLIGPPYFDCGGVSRTVISVLHFIPFPELFVKYYESSISLGISMFLYLLSELDAKDYEIRGIYDLSMGLELNQDRYYCNHLLAYCTSPG
jgi:hypothetical protein